MPKKRDQKKKAREKRVKQKLLRRRAFKREEKKLQREIEKIQWENRERLTPIRNTDKDKDG